VPEKSVIEGWLIGAGVTLMAGALAAVRWLFGVDSKVKALQANAKEHKEFRNQYRMDRENYDATIVGIKTDIATINANVANNTKIGEGIDKKLDTLLLK